jgi:hypothetical protein
LTGPGFLSGCHCGEDEQVEHLPKRHLVTVSPHQGR